MAVEEHLNILSKGVEIWNEWKRNKTKFKVDLKEANLQKAYLPNIDLVEANLSNADLTDAILDKAVLVETKFHRTILKRASLIGTTLIGAEFVEADLRESNLSGSTLVDAILTQSNLSNVKLKGTMLYNANLLESILINSDLDEAIIGNTIFGNANLKNAKNLKTCEYVSPSIINHQTISTSQDLPLEFLRGCGLSDWEIELTKLYQSNLTHEEIIEIQQQVFELLSQCPIQFYSYFISYSTKDEDFAKKLCEDLQNSGIRCWFAPHHIQAGKKIYEQIDKAILTYDRLLVILSQHSMNSEWVKTEIANARQKEIDTNNRVLFPIRLVDFEEVKSWKCFDTDTGKDSAREIREYYIPDFKNWNDKNEYKKSFERLLRDLKL